MLARRPGATYLISMPRQFSGGRSGGRRFAIGPGLTRTIAWIIGITLGTFVLYIFLPAEQRAVADHWGVLTADSILRGHVWKFFTTPLFHNGGLAVVFDVLMLWLFVPTLEHFWGAKRFLTFFAATLLVGYAVSVATALILGGGYTMVPIRGLSPFIYASIAAYGVVFGKQPVQLFGVVPIKGRVLAIGTAIFVLVWTLFTQDWVAGAGFFGAMALAVLMTGGVWTPNVWWLKWRRWRLRRRYHVIDGGSGPRKSGDRQKWMN
jgi:membrane associated rhomboid family serine protease